MRKSLLATVATAGLVFDVAGAGAATLIPLAADGGAPAATLVAQGCGLGYSRGSYGRCRPSVFGFGAPGARRYGYGYRPQGYGYGYRPYGYGY